MKTKLQDWMKRNLGWMILVIVVVILFRVGRNQYWGYKNDMNDLSDSIANYRQSINLYQERELAAQELIEAYELRLDDYIETRDQEREDRINENRKHEKEIADLKRIPAGKLFVTVTAQLDTLSFD